MRRLRSSKPDKNFDPNIITFENVKKMLRMYFNKSNQSELRIYEMLLSELNEEIIKNNKFIENLLKSHFDSKEMRDYLELMKEVLEEKKNEK